jgi:hypothetical protein
LNFEKTAVVWVELACWQNNSTTDNLKFPQNTAILKMISIGNLIEWIFDAMFFNNEVILFLHWKEMRHHSSKPLSPVDIIIRLDNKKLDRQKFKVIVKSASVDTKQKLALLPVTFPLGTFC